MEVWLVVTITGLPCAAASAIWLIGDRRPFVRDCVAVGSSVAVALASLALLPLATTRPVIEVQVALGTFSFVPDGLAAFMAAIATSIGSLAIVFSLDYMRGEPGLARYYALLLLFIGAMCGLAFSGGLLLLLVCWEIVGLCSFGLIAFYADRRAAISGALRALVVTQLGGLGLLIGVLVARTALGSDEVTALVMFGPSLPTGTLWIVAGGFLLAASAKSAQFPFHIWLPGAMEAPTPVSALIHAATMVNAGVYLLVRFFPAFRGVPGWTDLVILVGVTSSVLGALMALASQDLKRVLAYSTISQLGYLFYAVGIGALFASQFHLLSHALFKALLFLAAGAVIHATGTRDLAQLGGLGRSMRLVRAVFVIGALALAGVPILNGFWSKDLILEGGVTQGPAWAAGVLLLCSGLTALYALRVTSQVFGGVQLRPRQDAPIAMRTTLLPLAGLTLISWLMVGPLASLLAIGIPGIQPVSAQPLFAVLASPVTPIALALVAAGGAAWIERNHLVRLVEWLRPLQRAAGCDFGLLTIENFVVRATWTAARAVASTHTGSLNWNIAVMLCGVIILVGGLGLGGLRG
jgi:NADH-quinone oxidoreductase subunit L